MTTDRKRLSIAAILALTALCSITALLCTPNLIWRHLPALRGLHHDSVLTDPTLIGASKVAVLRKLGEPTRISGPYSVYWAGPNPPNRSSLCFHYDGRFNIARVLIPDHSAPEIFDDTPVPIDLVAWQNQDDDTRHRMNLDLVNRWEEGSSPPELRTLADVERYFPQTNYVHVWNYSTGMLRSVAVSFDSEGHVMEVWDGND